MGLCLDIKVSTIYYYVKNTFRNDNAIFNIFNLTTDYHNIASKSLRCRVAYFTELELMSRNGLVFDNGLICIYEGYYIWDATNKIYLMVDVNTGII